MPAVAPIEDSTHLLRNKRKRGNEGQNYARKQWKNVINGQIDGSQSYWPPPGVHAAHKSSSLCHFPPDFRERATANFGALLMKPNAIYTRPASHPRAQRHSKVVGCLMGDRAFARARAAGKSATEAGHARAKAGADIALSIPAEYRD